MRLTLPALTAAALLTLAAPARADVTLFAGTATSPAHRPTKGAAVGMTFVVVGAEFEYATVNDDVTSGAPRVRTGMANGFVQPPVAVMGIRPYATTGIGLYQEKSGTQTATSVAFNSGGGLKVSLVGPLHARVDYRVFKLRGQPQASLFHRLYIGANLSF